MASQSMIFYHPSPFPDYFICTLINGFDFRCFFLFTHTHTHSRIRTHTPQCRFTALGALSLDSDMRDLIHYGKQSDRLLSFSAVCSEKDFDKERYYDS